MASTKQCLVSKQLSKSTTEIKIRVAKERRFMSDHRKRPKHKKPRGSLNVWEFRERVDEDGCESHLWVRFQGEKTATRGGETGGFRLLGGLAVER